MASPVYNQNAFRGINDDGSLTTATFRAALNTDFSEPLDKVFRLRFVVQNTANNADTGNHSYELWCAKNGGTYFQVTASSTLAQLADDANSIADNATTVQRIGTGSYTIYDSNGYNDGTTDDTTGNMDLRRSTEAEVECCLKLLTTDNTNGDTFDFRLYRTTGNTLNTYTNTPRVTVAEEVITNRVLNIICNAQGILMEPFAINSETGEITITDPSSLAEDQTWQIVVRATDSLSNTDEGTFTINTTEARRRALPTFFRRS